MSKKEALEFFKFAKSKAEEKNWTGVATVIMKGSGLLDLEGEDLIVSPLFSGGDDYRFSLGRRGAKIVAREVIELDKLEVSILSR